jgi:hypothetical protein
MKKLFLVLGAATLVACMHEKNNEQGTTVNEPAGAQTQSNMATNTFESSSAPRDVNQQPYAGSSGLNQQRGSGSASSSSLQGGSSSPQSTPSNP